MQIILKYFPNLSSKQILRFEKLALHYRNWNPILKIFPRKEIETIYEAHVLHSLAIAKVISFKPGSRILDVGTGGGFPGIPLAILFPECQFTLIDSMHKRILFVKSIIQALELKNTVACHVKIEDDFGKFDFVVSRAVASFPNFVGMVSKNISASSKNLLPNGIIYLKGGSFEDEIIGFKNNVEVIRIAGFFSEQSFQTKNVVYLPVYNKPEDKGEVSKNKRDTSYIPLMFGAIIRP